MNNNLIYELNEDGTVNKSTEKRLNDEEYLEQYRYLKECGFTITGKSCGSYISKTFGSVNRTVTIRNS